jgi:hypothetical protein
LVSEESSFYAPYMKEIYEDMQNNPNNNQDKPPRVQISMEEAMADLGVSDG